MRLVVLFMALLVLPTASFADSAMTSRQMQVEQNGVSVMPFDQTRTMHMFRPTPTGGTETIVSNDSDPKQVALIRSHLKKEAAAFARGDYTDPASIHGMQMPGLATLASNASKMDVVYESVQDGAEGVFTTRDASALKALHDWFEAQVSDHGSHAMMLN